MKWTEKNECQLDITFKEIGNIYPLEKVEDSGTNWTQVGKNMYKVHLKQYNLQAEKNR